MTENPSSESTAPEPLPPWWRMPRNWLILAGLATVGVLYALGARKGNDTDTSSAESSASDQRIEALRVTWNGMSAEEQHDLCSSVHLQGADVTADQVQDAAGIYGADAHDDVVWFLEEMACD